MSDFTLEYIEACKQAKEEGWLKWEPKWGDKCWHDEYGMGQVDRVDEFTPRYIDIIFKSEIYIFMVADMERDCTWLPTEGDLLKILKEIPQGMEDVDYCIYEDDVALALLKAVKAVRIKQVKDSAWSSYD